MKKNKSGFTLTEVLVTIVIMVVIAGLAIPTYFATIEQSRSNEARTNLNIIHMGEKIYRINNPALGYWGPGGTTIAATNAALSIDMGATYYDNISVAVSNGNNTYTARLQRNNFQGGNASKWFQYVYTNGDAAPTFSEGGNY